MDAVHAFRVRTLRSLGYETRVVLSNASGARPDLATPYRVDVSLVPAGGPPIPMAAGVAELAPGERIVLECAPFVGDRVGEHELVFHLLPTRLLAGSRDGHVAIHRDELSFYTGVQDQFVEYHRPDGFCAGVLYQGNAFNYDKLGRERTTLIQAPKVWVSDDVDTLISLAHGSADPAYCADTEVRCALVAEDGRRTSWRERIGPFSLSLLSMRERAARLGGRGPRFCTFYAVSETAALLPLTIQRHDRTGTIGLEHALPPIYYSNAFRGALRGRAIRGFARAEVFA